MPKKQQPEVLQVELFETDQGYVEGVALVWSDAEYLPITIWGGPYNGVKVRLYPHEWRDGCIIGPDSVWSDYLLVRNAKGDVVLAPKDDLTVALRKTRPPKRAKRGKPAAP